MYQGVGASGPAPGMKRAELDCFPRGGLWWGLGERDAGP